MTMNYKKHISVPFTLSLLVTALLFSTPACSNQSAINTNEDLTEYKEIKTSGKD